MSITDLCIAEITPAYGLGTIPWLSAIGGFAIFAVVSYFGIWLSFIIHEMGHVIGAWITRCRIFKVKFGTQPRFTKWIRGTQLCVSWFPDGAYVLSMPPTVRSYRTRMIIVLALGPIFTLGYLAGLFWLWSYIQKVETEELRTITNAIYLVTMIELGGLTGTLFPRIIQIEGRETGTDVLQIWQTITRPPPDPTKHAFNFGFTQMSHLMEQKNVRKARLWARKVARLPIEEETIPWQEALAAILIGMEQWDLAKDIAENILIHPSVASDSPIRWEAGDTFASAVLYGNHRDSMPRAIRLMETLIDDFPDVITLKGTLGSLLFETGKIEQAEALLKDVIAKSTADVDKGISSAYLSRIAQSRGAHDEARQYADTAIKTAGEQIVVKRILGLVEPSK